MALSPKLIALSGPPELQERIRSHGFEPVTVTPSMPAKHPPAAGECAAAHGWAETLISEAPQLSAAVLTTRCDQARRMAETLRNRTCLPVFLVNLPATLGTEAAQQMRRDELKRLDAFLSRLAASACPAPLDNRQRPDFAPRPSAAGGHRVGLLGCTLTETDYTVLQLLQQIGLDFVLYAAEGPLASQENSLAACSAARPPPIGQRPNASFFTWVRQASQTSELEGWVLLRQPWCDLYHAEVSRLKTATGLPCLDLETGASPSLAAIRTRAEAFAETLQSNLQAAREAAGEARR